MPPNILQLQREVESLSDERLIQEAQMPNMFPPYLTQQEMLRRETRRKAQQVREAQQPTNTVHDRLIERAMSGIGSIPQQLSPEQEMFARQAMMDMSPEQMMQQQMMMQNPMPQPMADGGLVGYQDGGFYDPDDPELPNYSFGIQNPDEPSVIGHILDFLGGSQRGPRYHGRSGALITGRQPSPDYGLGDVLDDVGLNVDPWSFLSQDSRSAVERPIGPVGENHSGLPTPSVARGEGPEGIASLQAPTVQRQELDLSQYFQMTPEEQAVLDRARADAQSLESRIDTESDRLSAQANILSNVARAMARGQVPTAGEPLRELQTAQRERREGIMDESRAMEMAALAQEAGLSRAEQEALMERAIIGEERDYQESLRERERQLFNQAVSMAQSDDPDARAVGLYNLQRMGVSTAGMLTENAAADLRIRALSLINDFAESDLTDDIETSLNDLYARLQVLYGAQPVPVNVLNVARSAVRQQDPEGFAEYEASRPALGS